MIKRVELYKDIYGYASSWCSKEHLPEDELGTCVDPVIFICAAGLRRWLRDTAKEMTFVITNEEPEDMTDVFIWYPSNQENWNYTERLKNRMSAFENIDIHLEALGIKRGKEALYVWFEV
jgi:hypothetical protein